MANFRGGTWQVGTKNGDMVYLDLYTGPDATGDRVMSADMTPDVARNVGEALIEKAAAVEGGRPMTTVGLPEPAGPSLRQRIQEQQSRGGQQ